MKKTKWCFLVLVLVACVDTTEPIPTEDIYTTVANVWSEKLEPVTPECEKWLADAMITAEDAIIPGTEINLSGSCPTAKGCHTVINERSYIYCHDHLGIDSQNKCYVHEYIHALAYCMLGNTDHYHKNDKLWADYGKGCGATYPLLNSVEHLTCVALE